MTRTELYDTVEAAYEYAVREGMEGDQARSYIRRELDEADTFVGLAATEKRELDAMVSEFARAVDAISEGFSNLIAKRYEAGSEV
jgi:hypothetical protein